MRIENIQMKNFRPYRDEEVEFTTGKENNINLVVGQNDRGKTSLMKAVKWAMYGGSGGKSNYEDMLHDGVKSKKDNEMFVRLEFSHDGSNFVLKRELEGIDNQRGTARGEKKSLNVDGEPYGGNIQRKIDKVLPPQIDRFYFFDAEEIEKTAEQTEEMEDKIERALGLHTVDKAKKHAKYIKDDYEKQLKKKNEEIAEKEEIEEDLDDLKNQKDEIESDIKDKEKKIKQHRKDISKIEEELGDIEETKKDIEKKEDLQEEKKKYEKRIKEIEKERKEQWEALFGKLIEPVRDTIVNEFSEEIQSLENELSNQEKARYRNIFRKEANDGECPICHNQHVEELEVEDDVSTNENITDRLEDLRERKEDLSRLKVKDINPLELEAEKHNLRDDIDDVEEDIEEVQDKIEVGEYSAEDIGRFQEQIKNKREKIENLKSDLEGNNGLRSKLEELEGEIETKNRKIRRKTEDEDAKKYERQRNAAKSLTEELDSIIDEVIERKRQGIEEEANKIFKELTNTPEADREFRLVEDSGYEYTIERSSDGPKPKLGAGKTQIMSLSFILGLNHYADREAPLVMDTPIMRLDREHRENVVDFLSRLEDQIILLLTNAEYDQVEGFLTSVGKEMQIKRDAEEDYSWIVDEGDIE